MFWQHLRQKFKKVVCKGHILEAVNYSLKNYLILIHIHEPTFTVICLGTPRKQTYKIGLNS